MALMARFKCSPALDVPLDVMFFFYNELRMFIRIHDRFLSFFVASMNVLSQGLYAYCLRFGVDNTITGSGVRMCR